MFRLPGFGGAAVFMRSGLAPREGGEPGLAWQLVCDVSLLSPGALNRTLLRPMSAETPDRLSAFFLAAAASTNPESDVAEVVDEALGLRVAVMASSDQMVGVVVSIVKDLDDPEGPDPLDSLDFETSRAALAQAAADVRYLTNVDADPGGRLEPPADWSAR